MADARATIYARLSMDRTGEGLGVERQIKACRKLCTEHGWTVAEVFTDNDTSATNGKARPGFEALLRSSPERIVVFHVDRLVRLTRDLERVIELGVNVHAVTAGHIDLSNPAGRAVARTVTAWSTYETEQKAVRQKAANDQRAEAGLPYRSQRPFGYEADGMTIRETEAAELRSAAEAVLAGRSLSSIAADLNVRGVLTATGKHWVTTTLKAALISPRNAGLRRHRGEVVGLAAWPAILEETTATAVRAILTDPSRSRRGPNRRYLLSGLLTCGRCRGPVVGTWRKDRGHAVYRCLRHVQRQVDNVDAYVTAVIVGRLSQPDAAGLFAAPDNAEQLTALRSELSGARARLDGLAEAFAIGDIDRRALSAGSRRLRDNISDIEQQIASLAVAPALSEMAGATDIPTAFDALPMDNRRQVIDALATVTLLPAGSGHRVFNPETVRIEWRRQ